MNNILNINRLWKVIKHDGYTFYHKFGLTLAIMFGIPIGIWFINYISAEIGQTGISRYSILNTIASITMILAPARIYRDCKDPRKGIGFATMPASSLEKFISMFFYCIIVTPIIFWAGSIIIDTLLFLIPCKNPYEGFLTNNLFVFKDLIEQGKEYSLVLILDLDDGRSVKYYLQAVHNKQTYLYKDIKGIIYIICLHAWKYDFQETQDNEDHWCHAYYINNCSYCHYQAYFKNGRIFQRPR